MPYLGKQPFQHITTYGKTTEGNFDVKNNSNQWKKHSILQHSDKLKFGLTHPDSVISQVQEKKTQNFTSRMSNAIKQKNAIPSKQGITTFGKPSGADSHFVNYPQSQINTQSHQIQNRRGSLWVQGKSDNKL